MCDPSVANPVCISTCFQLELWTGWVCALLSCLSISWHDGCAISVLSKPEPWAMHGSCALQTWLVWLRNWSFVFLYCLKWNWSFHFKNSITRNENSHRWSVLPYWLVSSHRLTFSVAESSPSTDVIFFFPLFESHHLKLIWAIPLTGGGDSGQEFRGLSIPYMGPTDLISSLIFALLFKSELIR